MKAIVAIDNAWGIGKDNKLLFHIKEDMGYFRKMTTGKVVVMGRKTFESLPNKKPLKDRLNIVITHNKPSESYDNVIFCDMTEIDKELENYHTDNILIIGGESIYEQFIKKCDTVYVTRNSDVFDADTYMPNLAFEGFRLKRITNKGKIKETGKNWFMEEWVMSAISPAYESVLWINNADSKTFLMYSHNYGINWRNIYNDFVCGRTGLFKEYIKSILSSKLNTTIVTRLNYYYRAEVIAIKDNNIIRVASFGMSEEQAKSNLTETITNILK